MTKHHCDCGCIPPHGIPDECARNREATGIYLKNVTSRGLVESIARGERLAREHHKHLRPQYGCLECPLDSRFVRDSADGEWYVPTATSAS